MSVNYVNYFKCPFCGYNNAKKKTRMEETMSKVWKTNIR